MPDEGASGRFERVVLPHLDAAYDLARWLTRAPQDADDVVQEASLRAFRHLEGCREASARAWFLRIVRNAAFDWLRRNRGGPAITLAEFMAVEEAGAATLATLAVSPERDPEAALLHREAQALADELVAALPPVFREVIVLRELEELSYREIAEVVGVPVGTVMSRLSRARGLLARAWGDADG